MMMIPTKRILRKNVWCDSDEQFITDITEAFNLWIHRVENLHQTNSDANIDPLRSDSQDTNNNDDSDSAADKESLSPKSHPFENLRPINVSSDSCSNDCSNEYTAEFGKQDFSVFCSTSDSTGEVSATHIPKILHFIWLGSKIPEQYGILINTWRMRHASWDVKLWTDEDVKLLILKNQIAYSSAKNWGMKSDILRYEILQKFGGVYIDTDYECLLNVDYLCKGNSFLAGIANTTAVEINNGLLGSCIGHPLLEIIIQIIHEAFVNKQIKNEKKIAEEKSKELLKTIQQMTIFSKFLSVEENISIANIGVHDKDNGDAMETIRMTGPGMLTKTVFEYLCTERNRKKETVKVSGDTNSNENHEYGITVFPYTVFNPIPNTYTINLSEREEIIELKRRFIVGREIRREGKDVEGDVSLRSDDNTNLIDRHEGNNEEQFHILTTTNLNTSTNLDTAHFKSSAEMLRSRNYFGSAAIHWWQRSWQSEHTEEHSS